jgi:hypothetical protein
MFHKQESLKAPQQVLLGLSLWSCTEEGKSEQPLLTRHECNGGGSFINYQIAETAMSSSSTYEHQKSDQCKPPMRHDRMTRLRGRDRYRNLNEKQKFLVFVKILFKVLEEHNESDMLRHAKAVVSHCTQRNRMGDSLYIPLKDATTICLRQTVGESYWSLTTSYFVGA